MYSATDAIGIFWQYHRDQGYADNQIMQPSMHSIEEGFDGYFVCRHDDGTGKEVVAWEVQFTDEEGGATITFPGEDPVDVTLPQEDDSED